MPYHLAEAADLEKWADRIQSRYELPDLIRRLVLATSVPNELSFRTGEGAGYSGWDGYVDAPQGTAYVPQGHSGWEMGVGEDVAEKLRSDYRKRTRNSRPFVRPETTFVFCTPRRWHGKEAWIAAHRGRTPWAAARVYDADDLALWLTAAPGVHVWLSMELGKPVDRVHPLAAWWESWSTVTRPPISPNFLLSGRGKERDQLIEALTGAPRIVTVRTAGEAESLAFISAAIASQSTDLRDALLSRALLIDEPGAWRYFTQQASPLILIPRFRDEVLVNEAVRHGHHVLLPVGSDYRLSPLIDVPRLSSKEAHKVLESVGLAPAAAGHAAALARRSLPAYRRVLAVKSPEQPRWATGEDGLLLALLVLAGSWSEGLEGDREALERLTEVPYARLRALLEHWRDSPDGPFRQTGLEWHVLAKEDAWRMLAPHVTARDLERFTNLAGEVLTESDPKRGMSTDERMAADIAGIHRRYSATLRKGMADSLGMLGVLGSGGIPANVADGSNMAAFATVALRNLLRQALRRPETWLDIAPHLPVLAEASPDLFLEVLEEDLQANQPSVLALFQPQAGFMSPDYEYPHLLWALEALAWSEALFSRVAVVMARLAAVAPKTSISNSPAESLLSFFRLWYPQCGAPLEGRFLALDRIRLRTPDVAWALMLKLLSRGHDVAHVLGGPGARAVLWRDWPSEAPAITRDEILAAAEAVSERLLNDVGLSPSRWSALVGEFDQLFTPHMDRAIGQLEAFAAQLTDIELLATIWDDLRRFIASHRDRRREGALLPEATLEKLEHLVEKLTPEEPAFRYRWLFETRVVLPTHAEAYMAELERLRTSAATELLAHGGLEALTAFSEAVEVPHEVGSALFRAGLDESGTGRVLELLAEGLDAQGRLARGFVWRAVRDGGTAWREKYLSLANMATWTEAAQAAALLCCPQERATLDLVDQLPEGARELYWRGVDGVWSREPDVFAHGVESLFHYRRPRLALDCLAMQSYGESALLSPATVLRALFASATTLLEDDPTRVNSHDVAQLLGWLRGCPDTDVKALAQAEWLYLPLLGVSTPQLTLHDRLAADPAFFVQIAGLLYRSDTPEPPPPPPPDAKTMAERAWELLHSWGTIPGRREDGTFDGDQLKQWAQSVQSLLQEKGLTRGGLGAVGEVLARSPSGPDGSWPHPAVCDVIENVESKALDQGFLRGVTNGRGVTWREIFDGGRQERELADRYEGLAAQMGSRWPRVGALLRQLAGEYRGEALRNDQEAALDEDESG